MNKHLASAFLLIAIFAASCKDNSSDNTPTTTAKSVVVKDLSTDTNKTDGHFTYFSFKNNAVVPLSDSATTNWDVAFYSTTIIVNSGVRGPGQGGAIVLAGTDFNSITEAPEGGYKAEATYSDKAIPTGSDNGWYHYDPAAFTITPIPGVVIIIRTADHKYAKMQIISYYKGAPAKIDPYAGDRTYTFRYVYQPDGSRKFD